MKRTSFAYVTEVFCYLKQFSMYGSVMDSPVTEKDIWNRAIGLLSRREYSRSELSKKLKLYSDGVDLVPVLHRLEESEYLSDRRFAESFIRLRIGQGHGLIRIRYDLKNKGVSPDLLQEVLEAQDNDWYSLAIALYSRKYRSSSKELDYKERARRMRFMSQRGFSIDEIKHAEEAFLLES